MTHSTRKFVSIRAEIRCLETKVFSFVEKKSFSRLKMCDESTNRFRFFYRRSEFPCSIEHRSSGHKLKWFFDQLDLLNLDFYLPLFAEGLRETKFPFSFIAFRGFPSARRSSDRSFLLFRLSRLGRARFTSNRRRDFVQISQAVETSSGNIRSIDDQPSARRSSDFVQRKRRRARRSSSSVSETFSSFDLRCSAKILGQRP